MIISIFAIMRITVLLCDIAIIRNEQWLFLKSIMIVQISRFAIKR